MPSPTIALTVLPPRSRESLPMSATATATATSTYGNFIAGEWRPASTSDTFENRSPSNIEDVIGHFAASGKDDAAAAVAAAAEAFESWRRTSPIARGNILAKAGDIIASRA